jgi:CRISPR/Cas system-associated exonuclease Cas4 (RecB family)
MRTIKASEIGSYLYCQRAWWYQKRGEPSENQAAMLAGSELHYQHGRAVLQSSCLTILAYALIGLAIILLTIHFTTQVL